MAITLAKDEKIIRDYSYAAVVEGKRGAGNVTSKELIITNRRIIHQSTTKSGIAHEVRAISSKEMPVTEAKFVDTYYGVKPFRIFLALAGLFLGFGFLTLILSFIPGEYGEPLLPIIVPLLLLIFGVGFALLYKFVRDYVFSCSISTDGRITPAMTMASKTASTRTAGIRRGLRKSSDNISVNVKVKINREVAQQMAEEIGSVIACASVGDFESISGVDTEEAAE